MIYAHPLICFSVECVDWLACGLSLLQFNLALFFTLLLSFLSFNFVVLLLR